MEHRSIVHEVSRVYRDISLELFVRAGVAPTLHTLILDIIDNQTSIMYNLCHATTEVDILIRFEVIDIFASQTLGHDESEHRSPFLATSIEYVIDGYIQCLVNGIEIGLALGRLLHNFICTAALPEQAWIAILQILSSFNVPWNQFFNYSTVIEELGVFTQGWYLVLRLCFLREVAASRRHQVGEALGGSSRV